MEPTTEEREKPSTRAVLKVLYLLAVTTIVFALPSVRFFRPWRWQIVVGIAAVQIVTLFLCRVNAAEVLRATTRLKWFFAFLLVCYGLLPGNYGGRQVLHVWRLPINLGGLEVAALMCLQILTVVLVSAVVRLTSRGTDLADGLARLGLPKLFVHAFDHTLSLLAGRPRPSREERGSRQKIGFITTLRKLIRGDVGFLIQSVGDNMERARSEVIRQADGRLDQRMAHDVAVVSGVALVMASLKMLKFLPGVPFAPGIKGVILLPLYVLASQRTWSRWGGTAAGSIMGVVGFLQGDGRFGVLDILQHVAPGLIIDLAMPLVRRLPQNALTYCALGFVATIARTATGWVVVLLLGSRAEVYLYPAVGMIPMLIAGTLSGFVTVYLLRAFPPAEAELPRTASEYSGEHEDDVVRRTSQRV
ncbi:MAG TPA: energy-coupling factor transporter transmembrane component T [Vicinamibacterales bacterium]